MDPTKVLFIMSDEHNPKLLGFAGQPLVKTLNLDALSARAAMCMKSPAGTTFIPTRAESRVGRIVCGKPVIP